MAAEDFVTVFDADNHYWETSDAFTRHRNPRFADRGVTVREVDGRLRYFIGDHLHPVSPGPADVNGRPKPGALHDYFSGRSDRASVAAFLASEDPDEHPEWFDREARLRCMDEQGLEAVWMFPSQGVTMESLIEPDIEANVEIFRAFNRWLDEDWGFAFQDRIFAAPYLTLADPDMAVTELEWAIDRGARIISIRNGPVLTRNGYRSPADPVFDPFWGRLQEAGVVLAPHAGHEDGYGEVNRVVAKLWGYGAGSDAAETTILTTFEPFVFLVNHHRAVEDFATALVAHGLFERFPRLRVAYIENGGTWVPNVLRNLQIYGGQNPDLFTSNPADQFIEHCWVAPFAEDSVTELARHLPVDRILFGSDWPHAEGVAEPRDFFETILDFSLEDQSKIMRDNARQLTGL